MIGDYKEKYYRIGLDWPNKAGKLTEVLATQKRLATMLAKGKHPEELKKLLLSVGEGYDVAVDLMKWMEDLLKDVCQDGAALTDGAGLRNQLHWQSELISEMLDAKNNRLDKLIDEVRKRNGL